MTWTALRPAGLGLSLLASLAACTLDRGGAGPAGDGGMVPSGDCDTEGMKACGEDAVLACDGEAWVMAEACDLGCGGKDPHCLAFSPSYVDDLERAFTGTQDFAVQAGDDQVERYSINTDTGEVRRGTAVVVSENGHEEQGIVFFKESQGAAAPDLSVFSVGSLVVGEGVELTLRGSNAIAVFATGDIVINGVVDLGARDNGTAGPGGFPGGETATQTAPANGSVGGVQPITGELALRGGGGGGSNQFAGGAGGGHAFESVAPAEGGAHGGLLTVGSALVGGGGGGAGRFNGGSFASYIRGGGGGGALLLVSKTRVVIGGIVRAPGDGGRGVTASGSGNPVGSGGGGGAGGTLIIEAPEVVVNGKLVANGGGGGASNGVKDTVTPNGQRGRDDATAAQGGSTPQPSNQHAGGAGGALSAPEGNPGESNSDELGGGGGGGGGAGFIVLRALNTDMVAGATVSPEPNVEPLPTK